MLKIFFQLKKSIQNNYNNINKYLYSAFLFEVTQSDAWVSYELSQSEDGIIDMIEHDGIFYKEESDSVI